MASIGPAPYGIMLLADLGAEVIRVDRVDQRGRSPRADVLGRGRRSICVDVKEERGVEVVLALAERSDVLVEGLRPGVMERLGLGPDACLERNRRLIYARMTGWGQEGPLAPLAGHDLTYIAIAGALHPIGPAGSPPVPPLNYVGDLGGGGALLALGVLAALIERDRSGEGQVIDAAMVDGAASLTALFHGLRAAHFWSDERGSNLLDGGAHFYNTYETADGGYFAVAALEPQFYAELLARLELEPGEWPQEERERWPEFRERLAAIFRARTRQEWEEIFEGSDACAAPVLALAEAPEHPHAIARAAFTEIDGVVHPAPAPRFSRTAGALRGGAPAPGEHTDALLAEAGFSSATVEELRRAGAVA